jgi:hypothetical protein
MLENTEGETKNGQSTETGNIGYTRRKKKLTFLTALNIEFLKIIEHK